ncbi:uncharacterized protein I206_102604 [Kwoniella pini CBS 10737]|uniref:Uncharacterized protein n=1 Tax=Kwoniella pini CBS 10737 TaxID=1296096 RepID=A0A1B9I5V1_9TREE|nr:uncharacterized protein I206_02958 [Kwoniella pini CBS 10737]OCF50897.1 hypothetical protein I206_02958 [Kwoniella pini CBS 10737]
MELSPQPDLVLEALQAHLFPSPILSHLPNTLRLFAHFQLLSLQIQTEATRALIAHSRLVKKLTRKGYNLREQVLRGALNEKDGYDIQCIKKNRQEASHRMLAFSLEFRKLHLVTLFTTPKVPLGQVQRILEGYFPKLEDGDDFDYEAVINDTEMYIRCMTTQQVSTFRHYQKIVKGWYDQARNLADHEKPPPLFTDFFPTEQDNGKFKQATLCKNMMREAEKVIEDIRSLEKIFCVWDEGEVVERPGYQLNEDQQEDLELGDAVEADDITPEAGRYTAVEKGKRKAIFDDRPTSVTGEDKATNFIQGRNYTHNTPPLTQSKAQTGIPPPIYATQLIPKIDMVSTNITSCSQTGSMSQATPIEPNPQRNSLIKNRRQTLPANIPITNSPSNSKKRPRQSLPSTSGPDYTAQLRSSDILRKDKLRPFQNSDLHRAKITKV